MSKFIDQPLEERLETQIEVLRQHYGWHGVALVRLEGKDDAEAIGSIVAAPDADLDAFSHKVAGAVIPEQWPAIVANENSGFYNLTPEDVAAEIFLAYKQKSHEGFTGWTNLSPEEKAPWEFAARRVLSLMMSLRDELGEDR